MSQDWYYENGGTRHGPVAPAALKQLADTGDISPDTLVWRSGMAQWVRARAVKGLFAGNAAPTTTPSLPPTPAPVARWESPLRANATDWHLFDVPVEMARQYCPSELPATISRIAGTTGVYALYAAASLVLLGGLLMVIRGGAIRSLAVAIGISFFVLVVQYVAQRLIAACDVAIQSNRSVLSSLAIPQCAFVLSSASALAGALFLWWTAAATGEIRLFLGGLAVLAVGAFAALVAIQPSDVGVDVKPDCRVAEEAVGVLTFFLKLVLRCAPLAFGAAVVFATFDTASVLLEILRATPQDALFLLAEITRAVGGLFAAASIPLAAYAVMLVYYLALDIISAIVSIPGKLDVLATNGRHASRQAD
jgi:hypothetical protein